MKTKKIHEEAAAPSSKGKVKIKSLKLTKETVENLSDRDAGAIRGGRSSGGAVVSKGSNVASSIVT